MKIYLGNQPLNENTDAVVEAEKEIPMSEFKNESTRLMKGSAREISRSFLYEEQGRRDKNSKHYRNNNGAYTAIYTNRAVHYYDPEEGNYKEVDNTLLDTGNDLETKASDFKTRFPKYSVNGKVFEVAKGGRKVTLYSHDLENRGRTQVASCLNEENDYRESKVVFKGNNTDLHYTVDSDRVKEDIVINERAENYEYDFDLDMDGLQVGISEDGKTLQLKDKESGEVKFYIPGPFMKDAAGAYSDLVYYEIEEQSENKLKIKVVADNEWMNAQERVFPVTVDPQVVGFDSSIMTFNYYKLEERQHSNGIIQEWVEINNEVSLLIDDSHKGSLKIAKNQSFPNRNIISAKLNIYVNGAGACFIDNKLCEIDIPGFVVVDITDSFKSAEQFCQVDFTPSPGNSMSLYRFAPQLSIEYLSNKSDVETKTFSLAGGVSGHLNLTSGEFVTTYSDLTAGSSVLPVGISHIHKQAEDDFGCGKNWRLNLHQTLKNSGNDYFYTDGAGQLHSFKAIYYYLKDGERKENYILQTQGGGVSAPSPFLKDKPCV